MRPISRTAIWLSWVASAGAAVASVVILIWPGAFPDPTPAPPYNDALAEARGWSAVTLGLALPLLWITLELARHGSLRGRLAWLGTLGYLVYTFLEFAVSPPFSPLYLVYIATFACAIPALILGVTSVGEVELAGPQRGVAIFALLMAVGLALAWLKGIVLRTAAGDFGWPQGDEAIGHVVQALDLGLQVPLGIATFVLLWRRRPAGVIAGAVMLVNAVCMGFALTAMVAAGAAAGGRSLTAAAPFALLPLLALVLSFRFFGALEPRPRRVEA